MLQFLPKRQYSYVEQSSRLSKKPIRETSEGYLERKTRHGSIISIDIDPSTLSPSEHRKDELIKNLKKEVKKIMEESMSKRKICIYSLYMTSFCVAVENCLLDGLRKKVLGLFGVKTTLALIHSISKNCNSAAKIIKIISEQNYDEGLKSNKYNNNYLWIRIALLEKELCSIVDYIYSNPQCRRYYEKDSLMIDPSRGGMIAAILVGPCAIDYTYLKPMDISYRDPTADELVQRSRIASTTSAPSSSPKRPPLSIMKRGNSIIKSSTEMSPVVATFSREYVFSLHQNMRSSLLYGKNNVILANNENNKLLKGYLSLHRENNGSLLVKWTPNQLMHSSSEPATSPNIKQNDNSSLWKYALHINMQNIIYLHLHQQGEDHPVLLVFVDTEGVQYTPLQFPPGQHCLSFLTCLESGLAPFSRLDPPLWNHKGKGKILPRLRRKISAISPSALNSNNGDLKQSTSIEINDYVFRIVQMTMSSTNGPQTAPILSDSNFKGISNPSDEVSLKDIESSSSEMINKQSCFSVPATPYIDKADNSVDKLVKNSLGNACETMRIQILSRAFYGWLAYCRHLKTIRTHLSSLVATKLIDSSSVDGPIDDEFWNKCKLNKTDENYREFMTRVYCYGIKPELRYETWPYLIKIIEWNQDIDEFLNEKEEKYMKDLQRWGTIEEEVIKRDQEAFKQARLRQSSTNGDINFSPIKEKLINNEVFEEEIEKLKLNCDNDDEIPDIIEEFGSNLHRIEKDVDRCDRTTEFFSKTDNLNRLKRIMCTYVWRHINDGYIQGMCDIAAPLLVLFENEVITLECFEKMMERMRINFPHGQGIENSLSNLRSIVQVMDPELYELMMSNSDFTHLYFAYRWFLLDFKRELSYNDIYKVWEVILSSIRTVSPHFQLFFALALLTEYRHIVIENNMDFTDIIKFFNEMAEKHNVDELLKIAKDKLTCLQNLIREMTN